MVAVFRRYKRVAASESGRWLRASCGLRESQIFALWSSTWRSKRRMSWQILEVVYRVEEGYGNSRR